MHVKASSLQLAEDSTSKQKPIYPVTYQSLQKQVFSFFAYRPSGFHEAGFFYFQKWYFHFSANNEGLKISGHVFTMTSKCETRCCFPATPTKQDFRVTLRSIRDILVCSRLTVTSENMTSKTVNLRALNFEHHNKNVFLSFIIRQYNTLNAKPLIHIQNMQFWVCMYA